jgi:hypothetical protein
MHIYVSMASINGNNLQPGDEVGVYDGETCVGLGILTDELTGDSIYLEIEVPRQFLWWEGFTPGDTIIYRFCSGGEIVDREIIPTYISNGPTFVSNGSCVVELRSVNNAPTITSDPVTEARPGLAYSYTVTAEDIDGDDLIYTALVLPGWLEFNESTHTLAATPGEGDVGDQHVTIRVSDGLLHIDHTFIITVDIGNHAPTFSSNPATSVVIGDTYAYTITAQDIDGDSLSYTAPVLPDWLTFFPEAHEIRGVPQSGDLGHHDVTLRVCDGTVSADQSFLIHVKNVNTLPSFTSSPLTSALEGDLYVYNATAEDAEDDPMTFSAPLLPHWLSFDAGTQILRGTPDNGDLGDHSVTLRVSDGVGSEDQNFVITVEDQSNVGIDDFSSPDFMVVYPNPSDGRFSIELSQVMDQEVSMEIMDPVGRILLHQKFPPYILINEAFELSDHPAGIYFIRIYGNSFQAKRKLMIH